MVAADFAVDDVAAGLQAAGHDARSPSLFLCEGVAAYLELAVLDALLRGLREQAADRSRLAVSLSVDTGSSALAARRASFGAAVAALGEPVRTVLTIDDAGSLFAATGWQLTEGYERARHAGLVTLVPAD